MKRIPAALTILPAVLAVSTAAATGVSSYTTTDNSLHNSNSNTNKNANENYNSNKNSNRNSNKNSNSNRNSNSNKNHQSQGQSQKQGQAQSQSSVNNVRAGNNNGNLKNSGNNTGTSSSRSSASQSNANSSAGNTTSTTVGGDTYIQQAPPRNPVSSAIAPALTSGSDSCMGSTSMGAQAVSFGASFGGTWTDENCVMLKNSTMLWNMGKHDAAIALMCGNAKLRDALEKSGTQCPQTAKNREAVPMPAYDTSDPYIAERMGNPPPEPGSTPRPMNPPKPDRQ